MRKYFGFGLLVIAFLLFQQLPIYSLPTLEELTQSVQTQINQIQTFQAEVITTMQSPLINEGKPSVQISRVYSKGTDKIRTEMVSPDPQVLIENGEWLYTQNPATGQVIKTKRTVKQERLDGLSQVRQINDYLKDYELEVKDADAQNFVLEGKPRVQNKYIDSMKIFFDKTTRQVKKINVYNKQKQNIFDLNLTYQTINTISTPIKTTAKVDMGFATMTISIDYQNVKINEDVSNSLFEI